MIPKIIHLTSRDGRIPEKWVRLHKILLAKHSDWEVRIWSDSDNLELVRKHSPSILETYVSANRPILRADIARCLFLKVYGGLYLDTDYEMLKPFDLLEHQLVLPLESGTWEVPYLGNCVFASVPDHPFWDFVLEDIEAQSPLIAKSEEEVIAMTGPGMITRVFATHREALAGVYLPPPVNFHPGTPGSDEQYDAIAGNPEVYGIHFCNGSWRALTKPQRLLRRLRRVFGIWK